MNSCILMAEIVQAPELRYTSDTQTPIAEMFVEFPGLRAEDPPSRLKVVGWGNLAQEIQERFHQGDRVVIEGSLRMNTVERPEGFKEKRAELTAQRIHSLGADTALEASTAVAAPASTNNPATKPSAAATPATKTAPSAPASATPTAKAKAGKFQAAPETTASEPDFDEIPF
ncbi:single-stranded DNA-binding protein [Stenomitos frigidus]|uniref:Single-stranded DNA-binding protein n=1 Tax=Stenomitos frigidus ULC18 TaxID=2107698 RepID=A0A2T1E926_9CYAN|nr:single-stranded DNA-binding protein [Stenomitos frigidus]PSB29252.1 single-stranded DNA-binding protein [Stenomitos frigidus ULC18]